MRYRNCIICPDKVGYEWYHPNRFDYDNETGVVWGGFAKSLEECIIQIDQWYEL